MLTLVASGMSYAQIARELFVTQSTVGYHLSNIYRKAQVTSRHELTELVRRDPAGFGTSSPDPKARPSIEMTSAPPSGTAHFAGGVGGRVYAVDMT